MQWQRRAVPRRTQPISEVQLPHSRCAVHKEAANVGTKSLACRRRLKNNPHSQTHTCTMRMQGFSVINNKTESFCTARSSFLESSSHSPNVPWTQRQQMRALRLRPVELYKKCTNNQEGKHKKASCSRRGQSWS